MNLNMVRPKNETEDLLLSITKNCGTLTDQTHRKAEETLEFKMIKPIERIHFKPPIQINGDWTVGLTELKVYNYIFNITKKIVNSNFIIFLMMNLVLFHRQKSEMILKKTWILKILQQQIYKMK